MNETIKYSGVDVTLLSKTNAGNGKSQSKDTSIWTRKRYLVLLLTSIGEFIGMLLHINLSVAIIEMTSNKNETFGNEIRTVPAEFQWTSTQKGLILGSFTIGALPGSFVGAILVNSFGGSTMFGFGIAITGILTLLSPLLLRFSYQAYIISRIIDGLLTAIRGCSIVEVCMRWAVPEARSRFMAISYGGAGLGVTAGYSLCGFLTHLYGWEALFYLTGMISTLWSILWFVLVRNNPAEDRIISSTERAYLQKRTEYSSEKVTYPWKRIVKSAAVLAYLNERFVEGWGYSFVVICFTLYIKDVNNASIQYISLITAIPNACSIIAIITGSVIADYLRSNRILSINNVHRMFLLFAQISAVILFILCSTGMSFTATIIFISLSRLCFSIADVSYAVLPMDMGGRYASFILGLGNASLSIGAILNPMAISLFVKNHSASEWSRYFLFLSVFNFWAGLIFLIYGSGNRQPWAVSDNARENYTERNV